MLNDLLEAALFLLPIGAWVALLVILGRDPKADEHDLTDYYEPAPVAVDEPATTPDAPAPAPVPVECGTPVHDELAADMVTMPLDDEAAAGLAAVWLREFGDKARAQLELAR